MNTGFLGPAVTTVLTVYGIETFHFLFSFSIKIVTTVLTVYGIETCEILCEILLNFSYNSTYRLRY